MEGRVGNGRVKYVPLNVVADELGVSVKHVRTLIHNGHLEAIDVSGNGKGNILKAIRVTRESVNRFVENRKIRVTDAL